MPNALCAHCGERIGVYERIWLEQADGAVRLSSVLAMLEGPAAPDGEPLWHFDCLAPGRRPAA